MLYFFNYTTFLFYKQLPLFLPVNADNSNFSPINLYPFHQKEDLISQVLQCIIKSERWSDAKSDALSR